jgi:fluoride ion exporter CrcB/FEX
MLLIAIGGASGSVSRHFLVSPVLRALGTLSPAGTFVWLAFSVATRR